MLAIMATIAFIAAKRYEFKENKWYSQAVIPKAIRNTDPTTIVCITGTVHQPNKNYNADCLFEIISDFQPDLILVECDTAVYKNILKEYNRTEISFIAKIGRGLGFGKAEENETRAVKKYKYLHSSVLIRPYDYEGRDAFHAKYHLQSAPDTVLNSIQDLFVKNLLSPAHKAIWNEWLLINDTLEKYYLQIPFEINQPNIYRITQKRQQCQYQGINQIVWEDSSLKKYRELYNINADFWDTRNKAMAGHIGNFIKLFPEKRILVLTGFMHKYYLLNELSGKQKELNFRIKEYYDTNN